MKILAGLFFILSPTLEAACLNRSFCSTGKAPQYKLCSRGQDCTQAIDSGLQFKSDCSVSRWLGDAQETRKYTVEGNLLTILPADWAVEKVNEVYLLSDNQQTLTAKAERSHIFRAQACKPK